VVSSATISTLPGSRLVGRLLMEGSGLSRAMLELVSVGWHAGDGHRLADAVSVHLVHLPPEAAAAGASMPGRPQAWPRCQPGNLCDPGCCAA